MPHEQTDLDPVLCSPGGALAANALLDMALAELRTLRAIILGYRQLHGGYYWSRPDGEPDYSYCNCDLCARAAAAGIDWQAV